MLPLRFEAASLITEAPCQVLHKFGNELVCLFHRSAWLVDKTNLDILPTGAENFSLIFRKQWTWRFPIGRGACRLISLLSVIPGFRFALLLLFLLFMAKNRLIVLGSRHVL